MYFSMILAMQLPSQFTEQLFSRWFKISVLCNGIFPNKKQIKPSEKSITLVVSFKKLQLATGSIFLTSISQQIRNKIILVPMKKYFNRVCFNSSRQPSGGVLEKYILEKDCSTDVFLRILWKFLRAPFFKSLRTAASQLLLQ